MNTPTNTDDFIKQLSSYQKAIDADIATYAAYVRESTREQYGEAASLATNAYLSILERGGKRLRGALTMVGYEMSGGSNQAMIIQAARAMEMFHAYLLVVDDIQDRSILRRGGPAAHEMLREYHERHHLLGGSGHFGMSLALDGAMAGAHAAEAILANLDADPQLRLNALSITNRTLAITHHGQANDLMNEVSERVAADDVEQVMAWKTALYSFLNPLHVGMVLAGADCHATDAITDYATHLGKAFQLTDDLLGTFGREFETGKSPMDDIREGKRTLLMVHALEKADGPGKKFLLEMLGNKDITPAQFERCKSILIESSAVDFARVESKRHIEKALVLLNTESYRWPKASVGFLQGLATYLLTRTT